MNLLAHSVAQCRVYALVPPDLGQPLKSGAHNQCLEMLAIAHDFDMIAIEDRFYRELDGFRRRHLDRVADCSLLLQHAKEGLTRHKDARIMTEAGRFMARPRSQWRSL